MIADRAITDFADHLVPEAFTRRHSAYRVEVVDRPPAGRKAFDRWVGERITESLADRYAVGGHPCGYVIVEDADGVRWRWEREYCCQPEWLVDRVRREAHDLPQPWVFAVELPRPEPVWEVYDPDLDAYVEAVEPRLLTTRWTAFWYAEARGRGVAAVQSGAVDLDGEDEVGRYRLRPDAWLPKVFHRVLYAHPDRKRHPLRRR